MKLWYAILDFFANINFFLKRWSLKYDMIFLEGLLWKNVNLNY